MPDERDRRPPATVMPHGRDPRRQTGRDLPIPRPPRVPHVEEPSAHRAISQHPAYESPEPPPPSPAPVEEAIRRVNDEWLAEQKSWLEGFIKSTVRAEVADAMKAGAKAVTAEPDPVRAKLEADLKSAREDAARAQASAAAAWDVASKSATARRTEAETVQAQAETTLAIPKLRTERWKAIAALVTALAVILGALGVSSLISQCRGPNR